MFGTRRRPMAALAIGLLAVFLAGGLPPPAAADEPQGAPSAEQMQGQMRDMQRMMESMQRMMGLMQQMMGQMQQMMGQAMGGRAMMGRMWGMGQRHRAMDEDEGAEGDEAGPVISGNTITMPAEGIAQAFRRAAMRMHRAMFVPFTADADRDFALAMAPHHQGAVDMAKLELQYGKDPELRALAEAIVKSQEAEIAQLKAWLDKHPQP